MSRNLTREHDPRCEYCKYGKLSADGDKVLCPKKGIMDKYYSCKKFRYDPLKRVPDTNAPEFMTFSPEDFAL